MNIDLRILLVGDYSAVHSNLAFSLKKLGYNVDLASSGDNFKNFARDIDLSPPKIRFLPTFLTRIYIEYRFLRDLKYYDIIQVVGPGIFSRYHFINPYKELLKKGKKTFVYACGDDFRYWEAYRHGKYRYSPHKDSLSLDYVSQKSPWEYGRYMKYSLFLENSVTGIITAGITYKIAYENHPKYLGNIPFPVVLNDNFNLRNIKFNNPYFFIHGKQKNRYGVKGTYYIEQAFEKLKVLLKDRVFFEVYENIPFIEYLKLLERADGIFDQASFFDPGMNALINMQNGRLVFGGCEREFLTHAEIDYEPLINILPDVDSIVNTVMDLVNNPERMLAIRKNGFRYVSEKHNALEVARKFIKTWSGELN